MVAALAALNSGPDNRTAVVSPLIKVRAGAELRPGGHAFLAAARGECEGTQVGVRPPARATPAEPIRLEGPQATLPVRVYREAYVNVTTASNSEGETGKWPDPLIPIEDAYE